MYRQLNQMMVLGLTGVVAMLTIVASGCNDDPPNGPEPIKEYAFWTYDDSADVIYRIWPKSAKVDTLISPWDLSGQLTVSADGTRLFLPQSNRIIIVDTSLGYLSELPYGGTVWSSSDSSMIAVTGNGLRILDAESYHELSYYDSGTTDEARFYEDDNELICVYRPSPDSFAGLLSVQFGADTAVYKPMSVPFRFVKCVSPVTDPDRLVLYCIVPSREHIFSFGVYDIAADSFVYEQWLLPGEGRAIYIPSRDLAVYDNPGGLVIWGGTPSFKFTLFDVGNLSVIDSIDTRFFVNDSTPRYLYPQELAACPEGRYLAGVGDYPYGEFFLYDLETDSFLVYINAKHLRPPACQLAR